MNFFHDLAGVIFRISVFALSSSVLYKMFKQYGLPMLQKRAGTEVEQRAELEHAYQDVIQEKLMAEKNLLSQQQQLNQLTEKIARWHDLVTQKQAEKAQTANSCLARCNARREKQMELEKAALMKKMIVRQAIEKTREELSKTCRAAQPFATLLNQLIKE